MAEQFHHIKGLSELQRQLDQLPAKVEANVLRGALRAGSAPMAAEAQRLVPEETGRLKRGIRISTRIRRGRVETTIKAGGRSKETMVVTIDGRPKMVYVRPWYAHLVEYGTAAHRIVPKSKKSLFLGGLFAEGADHPGARPKPFMRPAFDTKWRESVEAAAEYIRNRLPRELRKVR